MIEAGSRVGRSRLRGAGRGVRHSTTHQQCSGAGQPGREVTKQEGKERLERNAFDSFGSDKANPSLAGFQTILFGRAFSSLSPLFFFFGRTFSSLDNLRFFPGGV